MLRPRRDMRRETSPSNTPITTPMRIGNFDISAGELLSGTIVATIESTSSTTGTASATASTLPSKGAEHTWAVVVFTQAPKRREHRDIAHEQKDDVHREEDPKDVGTFTQRNLK